MENVKKYRSLRFFLKNHQNQRILLGTDNSLIIVGTLIRYSRKAILLKDAHLISAREEYLLVRYLTERTCSVTTWGTPTTNPFEDVVLTGQICDCNTRAPSVGALIKVMLYRGDALIRVLGYTYSGSDGWYMFPLDRSLLLPNDRIEIQIVGSPGNKVSLDSGGVLTPSES